MRWLVARCAVLLVAFGLLGTPVSAAEPVRWLAQQRVPELEGSLTLEVDAEGALWVGGKRGLRRWDGQSWWQPPGVPARAIRDLAFDADGVLWVATERGLGSWQDGRWQERALLPLEATERVRLLPRDDGLWLSTIGGIRRYQPAQGLRIESGLPEASWYGLATAADGALLAAGRPGLYRREQDGVWQGPLGPAELAFEVLDARDGTRWIGGFALHRQQEHGAWSAPEAPAELRFIRELRELPDGSLWVGTHGNGLHLRDPDGRWRPGEARLAGEMITAILPDAWGNIWVATEGGDLHQFQRGPMAVLEREQGLPGRLLAALATTSEGALWLSIYGSGLYRIDPDSLRLEPVESPCGAEIRTLFSDGPRLWMGAAQGLCERSPSGDIRLHPLPEQVDALARTGQSWWLASPNVLRLWRDGVVVQQYGATEGLPSSPLYRLQAMPDGGLWAGGQGGLWHLSRDGSTRVLATASVQALELEPRVGDQAFWALTEGSLMLVDGHGIRAHLEVDPRHWLLLADAADGLWLLGPEQAERWPRAELIRALLDGLPPPVPQRYGPREGLEPLQNVVIGGPSHAGLPDGRRALIGYGRLMLGRLEALSGLPAPRARIDGLRDREGQLLDRQIVVEPGRLPLRIDYTAPMHREAQLLRFRHRLLPLEPDWSVPGSARQQVYAHLPGGDYRFEVQALPLEGREPSASAGSAVEFRIAPRWHERWSVRWLLMGVALLVGGALLRAWLAWRTRRLLLRQQELTQLVEERTRQLAEANRQLATLARTDPLTGLSNRRGFEELLDQHWNRLRGRGAPLSAILLDVDHFKSYNDRYGHPEGDACLREVGRVIAGLAAAQPGILATARQGGEEFGLLVEGDVDRAMELAERLRDAVAARALPHAGNPASGFVTASLGVADSRGPWPDAAALIDAADRALYRAKRAGRNRVEATLG